MTTKGIEGHPQMHGTRPLVVCDEEGRYRVHEATAEWLETVHDSFAVLSCAGKFRTGKSFLLNKLVNMPAKSGFGVGETVQACTRGIWASSMFMKDTNGADVLVLDTEGIDAMDASTDHDVRIVAIAVLISTAFVYNSNSHLDESAIQALSLMTRVAAAISEDAAKPMLYWVLRDFALKLVDASGAPMTNKEYLEQALSPPEATGRCETRSAIKHIFPERHLVTLPRPHKAGSNTLQTACNPTFERSIELLRKHICANVPSLAADGIPVSGKMFVAKLRSVVARINESSDVLPDFSDSWTLLAKVQHAEQEVWLRSALAACVVDECPVASPDDVTSWIREQCTLLIKESRFLEPGPDLGALCHRLSEEAFMTAKSNGKVRDVETIAAAAVSELTTFIANCDDARIVRDAIVSALSSHKGCLPVYDALVKRLFPVLLDVIAKVPLKDPVRPPDIDPAEFERLQRELADARELLSARVDLSMARVDLEDACVGTDDVSHFAEGCDEECRRCLSHEAQITDLETQLRHTNEHLAREKRKLEECEQREESCTRHLRDSLEKLQDETYVQLQTSQMQLNAAQAAEVSERECKLAIQKETERVASILTATQDKLSETYSEHLRELHVRECEYVAKVKEHMVAESKYDVVCAENRALKRRLDELYDENGIMKRLKQDHWTLQLECSRMDVLCDASARELRLLKSEHETLLQKNHKVTVELSKLQASLPLQTFRKHVDG